MFPFIYKNGDTIIPTFFTMLMLGALAMTFYAYWLAPRRGLSQIAVLDISLIGTVAALLGARLVHVFVEAPAYYWEKPARIFYFWQGGFVGYGVFIGVVVAVFVYCRIKKLDILEYLDLCSLAGPLVIFIGRIGCIGAGCCYGKPTDFFLHLVFHNPLSTAGSLFPGVPLHMTQVYDILNAVLTFIVTHWADRRRRFKGQTTLVFIMTYAFFRFFIEFLRGDADRGVYLDNALSTSQIAGIIIWVAGLFIFYRSYRTHKTYK